MTTARGNAATFLAAGLQPKSIFDLVMETIYEASVRRALKGIQRAA
jgi:hypothetical protein